MGLINSGEGSKKVSDLYLELSDVPKRFRPLAKDTLSVWIHKINSIKVIGPDAQPRMLRKYSTEICVSVGRSGAGCLPCSMQDPMWDKLDQKSKTNKKGARTDFPKSCVDLLPVVDLDTGKVRILKGGNQLYENMGQWLMSQSDAGKDLRRCEWTANKTGKELFTKYSTVRLDATPFVVTPELEAEAAIMLERAKQDMAPLKLEAFMAAINGDNDPMSTNANAATVSVLPEGFTKTTPATQAMSVPTIPQQPEIPVSFTFEPKVSPIPVTPAPAASPTSSVVEAFSVWVNSQPEFQGMGAFENLIPVLQEKIGGVNFHKCTPAEIDLVKTALTAKLEGIRAKKA